MQLYDPTSSGPERHLTRAAALGKLDAPAPADTLKAAAAKADFLITGLGD